MSWKSGIFELLGAFVESGWRASAMNALLSSLVRGISPRKKVVLDNLSIAYPEASQEWRRELLSGMYEHFCWMTTEYLALQKRPSRVLDWVVQVDGEEHLQKLLKSGTGCILLTAHIGNWELLSAWLCQRGYPLYAAVRDPSDPELALLMEKYRQRVGLRTLRKYDSDIKQMIRLPRDSGAFLGLVADQDAGPHGQAVSFLGGDCTMASGPASISLVADVPVIPIVSYRLAPFRHQVIISPPLSRPKKARRREEIRNLSNEANTVLEKMVRAYPEQWLWMHRRWKTPHPVQS